MRSLAQRMSIDRVRAWGQRLLGTVEGNSSRKKRHRERAADFYFEYHSTPELIELIPHSPEPRIKISDQLNNFPRAHLPYQQVRYIYIYIFNFTFFFMEDWVFNLCGTVCLFVDLASTDL